MKNYVITPHSALIDGKQTGLAGCDRGCEGCIRGDIRLIREANFGKSGEVCKRFIPYEAK